MGSAASLPAVSIPSNSKHYARPALLWERDCSIDAAGCQINHRQAPAGAITSTCLPAGRKAARGERSGPRGNVAQTRIQPRRGRNNLRGRRRFVSPFQRCSTRCISPFAQIDHGLSYVPPHNPYMHLISAPMEVISSMKFGKVTDTASAVSILVGPPAARPATERAMTTRWSPCPLS